MAMPRHRCNGRELKSCLLAVVRLLFKLVLADVICSHIAEWIIYGVVARRLISKPNKGKGDGLQVIICGISRSGSTSLQYAMDILGFPCFHGVNLMKPTQCKIFMKAYKTGNKDEWDCLLNGYMAIADFPAASCYQKLMELYPDAKVILNIRDPQRWYKSFSHTILKSTQMVQLLRPSATHLCVSELLYDGMLHGKALHKESSIHSYNLHTQEVKANVRPASRLLVYEFGDHSQGWAPLCEFLRVDIPQVPFPFSNESKSFQRSMTMYATIHSLVVALYFTLLYFTCAFLFKHLT